MSDEDQFAFFDKIVDEAQAESERLASVPLDDLTELAEAKLLRALKNRALAKPLAAAILRELRIMRKQPRRPATKTKKKKSAEHLLH
jgi:hypothetical protein